MMKCLYIQRVFPAYRKSFFDLLSQNCNLRLIHSTNTSTIKQVYSDEYSIKVGKIKYGFKDTQVFLLGFWEIVKFKPDIIIHEQSIGIISLPAVLFLAKVLRIRFVLHGHGFNLNKGFSPETSLADKYRLWLIKKADYLILYGNLSKNILIKYVDEDKIVVAHNSVDSRKNIKLFNKFNTEGIEFVKRRLGFNKKYNLIYVGRLVVDKRLAFLINSFFHVNKVLNSNVFLHIIGSGDQKNTLVDLSYSLGLASSVRFYGDIYDESQLGEFIFASDLVVNPGYVGLSLNHAFSFGRPIITVAQQEGSGPYHSPEIEYLDDRITGILVHSVSELKFAEEVIAFLANLDFNKEYYQKNTLEKIQEVTVENMVLKIVQILKLSK
jgi:glycosyltransferase involved in cell wall biosynthesis